MPVAVEDLKIEKKPRPRASRENLEHTISQWCTMTGRDVRTILAAFRKLGFFPATGELIPFQRIEQALFGEEHEQKMEAMRLDNSERRRREEEAHGNIFHTEELEKFLIERLVLPLTSAMAQMPFELAPLLTCDRDKDAKVIADYIETKIKPALRAKLKA